MNLNSPITQLPLVGSSYSKRLEKLGIKSVEDLILHVPSRYQDFRIVTDISKAQEGETVTIRGEVNSVKNIYTKSRKRIQIAEISDNTGKIQAFWFNQPFIVKNIKKGEKYSFSGKVGSFNKNKALTSPQYENIETNNGLVHTGRLVPIYPETAGVSSKWLRGRINFALKALDNEIEEFLPQKTLNNFSFPNLNKALNIVHFPDNLKDAELGRKRLSFNELLIQQLKSLYRKKDWQKIKAVHNLKVDKKTFKEFYEALPFQLTQSQIRSVKEVLNDLSRDCPMNRLLEGDVGSGKTAVAAAGAFAAFVNGYQSVFMAPTQILAQQHYTTLKEIFDKFKVRVSLVTSAGITADLGKTDIFVGTHALIHKRVEFEKIAFVVIDEQHRFGVEQRAHLAKKSGKKRRAPHVLTMTATPIPRTVALTIYGDLDLSTLDELPKGRKPITTWLVPPQKREGAYGWIKAKVNKENIQVFVICPLIEESEVDSMKQVKAATAEQKKLEEIFQDFEVGLLHGKQSANTKNEVLGKFKKGKTDILVSTPVVEVGIDVPNATIMIIEGAERFGLAQLHQLRGRIGRGEKKSYCLLFTNSRSQKVMSRLKALKENKSGFQLAELDLQLRGPGEVFGTRQHGFPELKIASWQDTDLIKKAKKLAKNVVKNPKMYANLTEKIETNDIAPN